MKTDLSKVSVKALKRELASRADESIGQLYKDCGPEMRRLEKEAGDLYDGKECSVDLGFCRIDYRIKMHAYDAIIEDYDVVKKGRGSRESNWIADAVDYFLNADVDNLDVLPAVRKELNAFNKRIREFEKRNEKLSEEYGVDVYDILNV